MGLYWAESTFQQAPFGALMLRGRIIPDLGGHAVHEVKLGEDFLMILNFLK